LEYKQAPLAHPYRPIAFLQQITLLIKTGDGKKLLSGTISQSTVPYIYTVLNRRIREHMSFAPRPYQSAAVDTVLSKYHSGLRQMMIALPTGAGKTVVAALIMEKLLSVLDGKRLLFLAHRKEIIEQTAEKIAIHLGADLVTIEQAETRPDPHARIVVASIPTLANRLQDYDPELFGAVIVDECHHSYAKSWQQTIGHFGKCPESLLLGLTATSRRSDGRCVSALFQELVFEITLGELQEAGHLVPLSYFTVEASLGLNKLGLDHESDFPVSFLGRIMNTPEMISLTLRAWREQAANLKTIAFCAGVDHAEALAKAFRDVGISAACIHGETLDRDQIIKDFRRGRISVLTNYGVLTEGFDEPTIECVLLCRPTRSPLVYTQCLGRGLRSHRGKSSCTVIDIIDRQSHGLQYNAFEAAGLKKTWIASGKDPNREALAISKIRVTDPMAFMRLKNALSMDETQSILMGLDPKTVLTGIDGMPVLRYSVPDRALPSKQALAEAERLIQSAGFTHQSLTIDETTETIDAAFASEQHARLSTYLAWHIQKATGWKFSHSAIEPSVDRSLAPKPFDFDQNDFDESEFMLIRQSLGSIPDSKRRSKRQGASAAVDSKRQGAQAKDSAPRRRKPKDFSSELFLHVLENDR
jgi:ATP-dependent helicase IRC3